MPQLIPALVLILVAGSCASSPRPDSPLGTWIIVEDSTSNADYITVSRSQSISDIDAPTAGGITISRHQTEFTDGQQVGPPSDVVSVLRHLRVDYFTGDGPDVRLTSSKDMIWGEQMYLELSDPDSIFAVYEETRQPAGFIWRHRPVPAETAPAFILRSDSVVFSGAQFEYSEAGSRYGTESTITARGALVFARRFLRANRKTRLGESHICCVPYIYSMQFQSSGRILMYGRGWYQRHREERTLQGRWAEGAAGEIRVDFGDYYAPTYRFTVNRQNRMLTVVEQVPCDADCQTFFGSLLGVTPRTRFEIRSERTRMFRWEADVSPDSLPLPPPPEEPDYVI